MIFRRKHVEAGELIVAPAIPKVVVPDDASLPLVDAVGAGFELLHAMDLGHSLWRTADHTDLDRLPSGQIIIVAAYTPEDITRARPLMGRFMTILLGMGLGPHYGSRALQLGAVSYLDSSGDEGSIRGLFSDAVARVRIRRLRAAPGTRLN
jgi:hypothetical protein